MPLPNERCQNGGGTRAVYPISCGLGVRNDPIQRCQSSNALCTTVVDMLETKQQFFPCNYWDWKWMCSIQVGTNARSSCHENNVKGLVSAICVDSCRAHLSYTCCAERNDILLLQYNFPTIPGMSLVGRDQSLMVATLKSCAKGWR